MSFAKPKNLFSNLNPKNVIKNPLKALAPPGVRLASQAAEKAGLPSGLNLLSKVHSKGRSAITGGKLS